MAARTTAQLPCKRLLSRTAATSTAEALFHVLAVDDSPMDRKLATTVDSWIKALEFLVPLHQHETVANSIISDYCMPAMTGYDLFKKKKNQDQELSSLKDIPVVIMSSNKIPSRINRKGRKRLELTESRNNACADFREKKFIISHSVMQSIDGFSRPSFASSDHNNEHIRPKSRRQEAVVIRSIIPNL